MSIAKMTLLGFYNAMEAYNTPLFDEMVLPAGIDKEIFIDALLMECGEMEVLYANPDFFRNAVTAWSKKWLRTFLKWYEALQVQYDPLNNYDRTEEWDTDSTFQSSGTTTNNATTTTSRSAYDSSTLTPYDSATSNGSGSDRADSNNREVRKGRAYGNIGVTTSQQMLQSELDLQRWNLYSNMIDIFKEELLIAIY